MITSIITAFLLGVPAVYVLRALILEPKDDHEGPFKSWKRIVLFPEREGPDGVITLEHRQFVALFDWIRRLFGVYTIYEDEETLSGEIWEVRLIRSERFTCPYCLSFWVAFLFSVPFTIIDRNYIFFPVYHFGIAIVSLYIYRQLF